MTQPSLIARIVAEFGLEGEERVLEVGTGLGFQSAILAMLAKEVFSIERFPDLAERARRNLEAAEVPGVIVAVGDGTTGFPDRAPFDATVVSAAAPDVPVPLVEQLTEGGGLVHPLGPGGYEMVIAYRKRGGQLVEHARLTPARSSHWWGSTPSRGTLPETIRARPAAVIRRGSRLADPSRCGPTCWQFPTVRFAGNPVTRSGCGQ